MIKPEIVNLKELKEKMLENDKYYFMRTLNNSTDRDLNADKFDLMSGHRDKMNEYIEEFKDQSVYVFTTEKDEVEGKFKWVAGYDLNEKIENSLNRYYELNQEKSDVIKKCFEYVKYEMKNEGKNLIESSAISFLKDFKDISNDSDSRVLNFAANVLTLVKDPNEVLNIKSKFKDVILKNRFIEFFSSNDEMFFVFSNSKFNNAYEKLDQKIKNHIKDAFFEENIYSNKVVMLSLGFKMSRNVGMPLLIKDVVLDERFKKLDINNQMENYSKTLKNFGPLFLIMAQELSKEKEINTEKLKSVMSVYTKLIKFGILDTERQKEIRKQEFFDNFEIPVRFHCKNIKNKDFVLSEFEKIENEAIKEREQELIAKIPVVIKDIIKDEHSHITLHKHKENEFLSKVGLFSNENKIMLKNELKENKDNTEFNKKIDNALGKLTLKEKNKFKI